MRSGVVLSHPGCGPFVQQAARALHQAGLLNVYATTFGYDRDIALGRLLHHSAKVLLLDEPSAGLNREEREDLARHILRIKHELGIPLVWVEHDMQMVADLADRLYVLNYGIPLAAGTPETVLKDPRVIDAYVGGATA